MYKRRKFLNIEAYKPIFSSNELNKLVLKSLLSSEDLKFLPRVFFFFFLQKYSIKSSISFFRKFCNIDGYSKSIFRFFKMSRHNSKRLSSFGYLTGMRKSSF